MPQYKTITELKATARNILKGKSGNAILVPFLGGLIAFTAVFVIMMVAYVFLFVTILTSGTDTYSLTSRYTALLSVLLILISCVIGVFNPGIIYFFLNTACGRAAGVGDLFYGFRHCFKKSLSISTILVIISELCILPSELINHLILNETLANILYMYLYLIGLIASTYIALGLSQAYYLMLDFPQYGVIDLLKLSWKVTKGHKARLFCLQLSFFPLILASVFTLGIGMLWVTPYMQMTYALFFLDLMNPKQTPPASDSYNYFR